MLHVTYKKREDQRNALVMHYDIPLWNFADLIMEGHIKHKNIIKIEVDE